MKLSQLKKKCPKAFTQFNSFALYKYKNTKLNENRDVRAEWLNITDFMDLQGIVIATIIITTNNTFYCQIYYDKKGYEFECMAVTDDYKSRKQAETKAICKAFEILEERL